MFFSLLYRSRLLCSLILFTNSLLAQAEASATNDPFTAYMKQAETALQEKFKGITTQGQIIPKLYSIKYTGIFTKLIQQAAGSLITTLN